MESTEDTTHYSIEYLLDHSVQPFENMTPEEFESLMAVIRGNGKSLTKQPVSLTEDGTVMWDGNQRCRAMLALGRKRLNADEARLVPGVDHANAPDWAIRMNANRRQLTGPARAKVMHERAADGWSHTRIAKAFGISRPAVSQLMAKYPAAEGVEQSEVTIGEDNKVYPRNPPKERKPKEERVWAINGDGTKLIRRLRKMLKDEIPSGLQEYEKAALTEELEALGGAVQTTIDYLETM